MGICDGRVVIVSGAGRGICRAHALEFAAQGAKVGGSATDRLRSASSALKGSVELQPKRSAAEDEVERRLQAARAKRGEKA
jgi:NAD(P)-dependent dehydrogenase (short-subunit alcohol dehydrogenase family)